MFGFGGLGKSLNKPGDPALFLLPHLVESLPLVGLPESNLLLSQLSEGEVRDVWVTFLGWLLHVQQPLRQAGHGTFVGSFENLGAMAWADQGAGKHVHN